MKKTFLWLLLSVNGWAACPLNTYPENHKLDGEVNNICDNILNPIINQATISSETVKYSAISTMTVSGQIQMGGKKIINLANGTASTDAAAFGQLQIFQSIISTVTTTRTTTTSTSFVSTTLAATITPTSTSNRIMVIAVGTLDINGVGQVGYATITRGSTNIGDATNGIATFTTEIAAEQEVPATLLVIDSPATTSATTYVVQIKSSIGTSTAKWLANTPQGTMILAEIK